MKRFHITSIMAVAVLSSAMLLSGCGASKSIALYGSEEEYGKAQLCDYSNLSVEKNVYEITDEMVDDQIESMLYDYTQYTEVDRPSQEGDYISALMTISSGGEVLYDFSDAQEGGYQISLGYGDFGEEFDDKLTGVKKDDKLTFTISYDADSEIEEFAGMDVDFDVTVSSVTEENIPALTDQFIKESLGYDSEEALRAATREQLVSDYNETSVSEMESNLLAQIIDTSTFTDYPEALFAECRANVEQNYAAYIEMFGVNTVDEIYAMFDMTSEDIDAEALDQVYQMIVLNQIAREQNMQMTKKEYEEAQKAYAEEMEYDSVDDLIADYGEESIKFWLMQDKVFAYLTEHATITEVPASLEDEYVDFDEDETSDEEFDDEDFTEEELSDDEALSDDFDEEDALSDDEEDDNLDDLSEDDILEDDSYDDEDFEDADVPDDSEDIDMTDDIDTTDDDEEFDDFEDTGDDEEGDSEDTDLLDAEM